MELREGWKTRHVNGSRINGGYRAGISLCLIVCAFVAVSIHCLRNSDSNRWSSLAVVSDESHTGLNHPKELEILFNEYPMIMAHDAATTYLTKANSYSTVDRFTKTQPDGGIQGLLSCGARAFDLRPGPKDSKGDVLMHHGPVTINKQFVHVIDELLEWTRSHPGSAASLQNIGQRKALRKTAALNQDVIGTDLILLGIAEAQDHGVLEEVKRILSRRNISTVMNCSVFKDKTVGDVLNHYGTIVAINDCWEMNFNRSITCSGFFNHSLKSSSDWEYTCYKDSETKDYPLKRMFSYLKSELGKGAPKSGVPYTVQGLWQETSESIFVSSTQGSSLLGDENRSDLNGLLVSKVLSKELDVTHLNMLEINNVCHHSTALLEAIRTQRGL